MEILIYNIIQFLLYLVGAYLLFNCVYLLFFSVAGHFLKKTPLVLHERFKRICVLIPAYRENEVILASSMRALSHEYEGFFKIVVIADGLSDDTINTIKNAGAAVIPVSFVKSTKGKSLNYALTQIPVNEYDIAVILDIDNIMADGFLSDINSAFQEGATVVQAHRTAKNLDSSFAFLDACNEEINNHIYRKGHFAVGLSPALIGSGMAFEFSYLRTLLANIGETVGEDKEMDFQIAKSKTKIVYLNESLVYDEKIENAAVFTQQRTRWIAAQIEFFKKYFVAGFAELFKNGNFEFFNKVLQAMLVPRMLLLGLLFLLSLVSLIFFSGPASLFYPLLFVILCFSLFLALPERFYKDKRLFSAIFRIPYALWCMVLALLRIKQAKKSFIPTPHTSSSIVEEHTLQKK
ncbi:glycosyltransferase family 2 protein [Pedobacter antarcticus]|uniref:glycosyltransferase n=1 Tax=Pedobacter antarcticus TaxID=34086 RepID=UPI0029319B81|nr:glycosyltransferase family 2 protein [Pedobacter antarcticus]